MKKKKWKLRDAILRGSVKYLFWIFWQIFRNKLTVFIEHFLNFNRSFFLENSYGKLLPKTKKSLFFEGNINRFLMPYPIKPNLSIARIFRSNLQCLKNYEGVATAFFYSIFLNHRIVAWKKIGPSFS